MLSESVDQFGIPFDEAKPIVYPKVPGDINGYIRGSGSAVEVNQPEIKKYHDAIQPFLKKLLPPIVTAYRTFAVGSEIDTSDTDDEANINPPELALSYSDSKSFALALAKERNQDYESDWIYVIEVKLTHDQIYFHYKMDPLGKEHPKEHEIVAMAAGAQTKVLKAIPPKDEEMEEARDDWKKEGYTFDHEISHLNDYQGPGKTKRRIELFVVSAFKDGKKIATVGFQYKSGALIPYETIVEPEHRRKGLASAMYAYAEEQTGRRVKPATDQTPDAQALWSQPNRPFGKSESVDSFGIPLHICEAEDVLRDWPYFHSSNHPNTPTISDVARSGKRYFDPIGIFLFIKIANPHSEGGFDSKQYCWGARLKSEKGLLHLSNITSGDAWKLLQAAGIDNPSEAYNALEKAEKEKRDDHSEFDWLQTKVDNLHPGDEGFDKKFYEDYLSSGMNVYRFLWNYFHDRNNFTHFLKSQGYTGIYDDIEAIWHGEPQVVVFDPNNIEWSERMDNGVCWESELPNKVAVDFDLLPVGKSETISEAPITYDDDEDADASTAQALQNQVEDFDFEEFTLIDTERIGIRKLFIYEDKKGFFNKGDLYYVFTVDDEPDSTPISVLRLTPIIRGGKKQMAVAYVATDRDYERQGLATELLSQAVKRQGVVRSDKEQTSGGKGVWKALARNKEIKVKFSKSGSKQKYGKYRHTATWKGEDVNDWGEPIEEKNKTDLDLSNESSAREWAEKNINDLEWDGDYGQQTEERVSAYVYKYKEVMGRPTIEIYRAVCLKAITDLDLKKVGTHWSFDEKGVGCYGNGGDRDVPGGKMFVLTATANTKDIDWEYGFTSFMYYGEDQWECALNPGSKVSITAVDDKELPKPTSGKA